MPVPKIWPAVATVGEALAGQDSVNSMKWISNASDAAENLRMNDLLESHVGIQLVPVA